jgi:hypothetical protein
LFSLHTLVLAVFIPQAFTQLGIFFYQRRLTELLGNNIIIDEGLDVIGRAFCDFLLIQTSKCFSTANLTWRITAGAASATTAARTRHGASSLLAEADRAAPITAGSRIKAFSIPRGRGYFSLFLAQGLIEFPERLVELFTELFGLFGIPSAREFANTAGTTTAIFAVHAAPDATAGNTAIITLAVALTAGAATTRNADTFHAFHSTDRAARGAATGGTTHGATR